MTTFRPKFVTFDLYGTLIWFQMTEMAREVYKDRIPADRMEAFVSDFSSYRYDEVLGAWKPYGDVIKNATRRVCARWRIDYVEAEGQAFYDAVPTWGPHPDVSGPLARVAKEFPLVMLSNASDNQIGANVEKLGAPVHRVLTAQQAQAYKPRFRAFEYMLDELGCGPENILHVSASIRYDILSAHYLGIKNKVYVNRGYEPSTPAYGYHEIRDIGGLPCVLGL
jgi:2-haloacid dehalogenase